MADLIAVETFVFGRWAAGTFGGSMTRHVTFVAPIIRSRRSSSVPSRRRALLCHVAKSLTVKASITRPLAAHGRLGNHEGGMTMGLVLSLHIIYVRVRACGSLMASSIALKALILLRRAEGALYGSMPGFVTLEAVLRWSHTPHRGERCSDSGLMSEHDTPVVVEPLRTLKGSMPGFITIEAPPRGLLVVHHLTLVHRLTLLVRAVHGLVPSALAHETGEPSGNTAAV